MPLDFSEAGTSVSLSPLFLPTPAKPSAPKAIASKRDGRVQVAVRIKPPTDHESESCLTWAGGNSVTFEQPEVENVITNGPSLTPKRCATPSRAQTPARIPGSILKTAGRTPGGVRTPAGRTPGGRTPAGRTPAGRTPGGRTPGGRTPGLPEAPKRFEYDSICGPECEQEEVFAYAQPLVEAALTGSNACVLAYGQTGSGKTFTMIGEHGNPGVVPRCMDLVWDTIEASVETEWQLTLTYVELYNDAFRDLLIAAPAGGARPLPIELEEARRKQSAIGLREERSKGGGPPVTYLSGSDTFNLPVRSRGQMHELLQRGHAARAVGCTKLNEQSSRSHAVITLGIECREKGAARPRKGKLHLVDLAGSESLVGESEAHNISHETRAINSALTALCDVMQTLSKNARLGAKAAQLVPYRNHKLTRLLGDSLGGNSTTLMLAAVHQVPENWRQTLATLKFAARARDITTHARVHGEGGEGNSAALRARVEELQARLARRELEIEKLEGLNAEREARRADEAQEREHGLEAQERAEREQLLEEKAGEARGHKLRAAEAAYAATLAAGAQHKAERAARAKRLQLHLMQDELAEVGQRLQEQADEARQAGEQAEAVAAQRDEALGRAEADCEALRLASQGWRADRSALEGLKLELARAEERGAELAVTTTQAQAHKEAEGRASAQAEAAATAAAIEELRERLTTAAGAARSGRVEIEGLRSLLEVLAEEESSKADKSSAKTTLKWLRIKLGELVERFASSCPTDEAMALPASLADAAAAAAAAAAAPDGGAKKSRKKRQAAQHGAAAAPNKAARVSEGGTGSEAAEPTSAAAPSSAEQPQLAAEEEEGGLSQGSEASGHSSDMSLCSIVQQPAGGAAVAAQAAEPAAKTVAKTTTKTTKPAQQPKPEAAAAGSLKAASSAGRKAGAAAIAAPTEPAAPDTPVPAAAPKAAAPKAAPKAAAPKAAAPAAVPAAAPAAASPADESESSAQPSLAQRKPRRAAAAAATQAVAQSLQEDKAQQRRDSKGERAAKPDAKKRKSQEAAEVELEDLPRPAQVAEVEALAAQDNLRKQRKATKQTKAKSKEPPENVENAPANDRASRQRLPPVAATPLQPRAQQVPGSMPPQSSKRKLFNAKQMGNAHLLDMAQ